MTIFTSMSSLSLAIYAQVINLSCVGWIGKSVGARWHAGVRKDHHRLLSNLQEVLQRFVPVIPCPCLLQTENVADWSVPRCSRDVDRFRGLVNYYRGFVKRFSDLSHPLYAVVGKNKCVWGEAQQLAFDKLKLALLNSATLALPKQDCQFILDTCLGSCYRDWATTRQGWCGKGYIVQQFGLNKRTTSTLDYEKVITGNCKIYS